jgi:UDP-N-acetylglucosamine:LPS N-acetylglucosamine transferase
VPEEVVPRARVSARRAAVVSASIGAGHDGAATELSRSLIAAGFTVDRYDFLDLLPGGLGRGLCRAYAMELTLAPRTWSWLLRGLERNPRIARSAGDLFGRMARRRTLRAIDPDVDVVVSTHHLASQALGWLRRTGRLRAPVVTFLTDMSVHPMWVAPGVDRHLALHDVPADQARRLGAAGVTRCRPAVHARFGPGGTGPARAAYGLPATAPLALVAAGSWGVGEVAESAADIQATGVATPVIACGRNEGLRADLEARGVGIALGWIDDMPALIRACDVVVHNAGGLMSLEAMACAVPVVSYRCLPGHGIANAAALAQAGLAPWPRTRPELAHALKAALAGEAPAAEARALFAAPLPITVIEDVMPSREGCLLSREDDAA